ncbi:hypothetical protein M3936_13655 [Sutcliffiella horikoshii]|uniref:hypothetical protein n=1 Tax=Sutcliffiella horikoshii TaxID=79883 RepID=UPI000AB37B08|nr:hypothetical protein [Sutcliffiella horikoshii]MCM3618630.1 hypothetical protein [Sutcliffiella horikoshii]
MNKSKNDNELDESQEKSFWDFSPVTFFLCMLTLIVGVITVLSFYDGFQVKKQERIAAYVNEMNELLRKSEQYSGLMKDKLDNGSSPSFSVEDEKEFRELMQAAPQIEAPSGWQGHKEAATELISERYMFFYHYFHGTAIEGKGIEDVYSRLDALESKEKEILLSSFDASEIPYQETEEGKITFSIKSY